MRGRTGFRARSLALVAVLASCAGAGPSEPAGDARFQGTIAVAPTDAPAEDALAGIWISTVPGSESLEDRIGLVIWPGTTILVRARGNMLVTGALTDLVEGASIRAWTTDVEYLSTPPQYDATRIVID